MAQRVTLAVHDDSTNGADEDGRNVNWLVALRVTYRVWRRHSLDHLLAVAIQVVLVGGDRRVRARLHQLRQVAER